MHLSITVPFMLAAATVAAAAGSATGAAPAAHPRVTLDTSMGKIVLELYPDKAPKTAANFLAYVKSGHYDNTMFHRVIKDVLIQGGGLDATGKEKDTNPSIHNEAENGLANDRGTVAMWRPNARWGPPIPAAEFFINLEKNSYLPYPSITDHVVFGKVVEGMDVVDKIANVPVNSGPFSEAVPATTILLRKATAN